MKWFATRWRCVARWLQVAFQYVDILCAPMIGCFSALAISH